MGSPVTYPRRLSVALTIEQSEWITEAATRAGLKPGVYARYILTGSALPTPPLATSDRDAIVTLNGIDQELRAIAAVPDQSTQMAVRQARIDGHRLKRKLLDLPELSDLEIAIRQQRER